MPSESLDSNAQVHLLAIRKALANQNAAVMVGAGFSRNAEGGENLATWRQLSEALASELEPGRPAGSFSPAAASQLAEQYSRVFSPTHLEQLIKRSVPDDQVTPGALHKALIELPWAEVFTTNYDTLLERAAERLFEVSYFTVCSREDIPQSKVLGRKRIVKLHGSFPSHRPFILTEEEYRTYPEKFAPFVNLVRQSLLENVFCLIGFSGDDPNFLHWLGWVRDMLDKHALPVYLFLAAEPTLGERKLYEARGVIPVLLPMPTSNSKNDYHGRYRALFDELKKPLSDSPLDWGHCPQPPARADSSRDDKQLSAFLGDLPAMAAYRRTYPGWIVAPKEVRQRFRPAATWLAHQLEQQWLRDRLGQESPSVVVGVLDLYCWMQQVTLGPVSDDLAEIALVALRSDPLTSLSLARETSVTAEFLRAMQLDEVDVTKQAWKRLAVALVTWARQSHRTNDYNEVVSMLQTRADKDAVVVDRLVYEEALRCLQAGDQRSAHEIVVGWRPKSSDAYTHVLRGALMAEVSDALTAMPILAHAIQTLRRQQRSRPGDPELVSKEAWACLVASHLQEAVEFARDFSLSTSSLKGSGAPEDKDRENFDDRLQALIARGYSAREELSNAIAKLNAEAELPMPQERRVVGFKLRSITTHRVLGAPSELQAKVAASFAWLELMERLAIPVRTANAAFYTDQMLQAAWWSRFADRPERSIGLLVRSHRREALKPHDRSRPAHRTGWLDRWDVARSDEDAAVQLSGELVRQIVAQTDEGLAEPGSVTHVSFLLDVLSRLVIRVKDEALLVRWGQELLRMYDSSGFMAQPQVWGAVSTALANVLEALPNTAQEPLLIRAFSVPLVPVAKFGSRFKSHQVDQWIDLHAMTEHWKFDANSAAMSAWRELVEGLMRDLQAVTEKIEVDMVWRRLRILLIRGVLSKDEQRAIGEFLWREVPADGWPEVPGEYAVGVLDWWSPSPNLDQRFLKRLLAGPLRPFSSGYMQFIPGTGRRSYSIGGVFAAVGQLAYASNRARLALPQMKQLVKLIDEWLNADLPDLLQDIHTSEISEAVADVVNYLDQILARCVTLLRARKISRNAQDMLGLIAQVNEKMGALSVERFRLNQALARQDDVKVLQLAPIARSIVSSLNAAAPHESGRAFGAAFRLLEDRHLPFAQIGRTVFDAVVACAFSQRADALERSLGLLASLSAATLQRYMTDGVIVLLDTLFVDLTQTLSYEQGPSGTIIAQEHIPKLRYETYRLAYAVDAIGVNSQAARGWLQRAAEDPLPEIRFKRYASI